MTSVESASQRPSRSSRSEPAHRPEPRAERRFEDALKRAKQDIEARGEGDGMIQSPQSALVGAIARPAETAALADAQLAAHLERIAAAIAELRPGEGDPGLHVTLPPGPLAIDGALIARGANGALTIVLTSAEAIAPAVGAQLQGQLADRLAKRNIRVGRIALERADGYAASGGADTASASAR